MRQGPRCICYSALVEIEKNGRIHSYTFPLLALSLVPIFIFTRASDPFNLPKALALFVLAVGGLTHLLLSARERLAGFVNYIIFALALTMVIASIFSDSTFTRVLFGLPGRNNGLIYYLSILTLLFIARNCLVSSRFEKRLLVSMQIPFLINIFYSLLQYLGEDPIPWANPYNPIIGTFGNPNFASSFLAVSAIFYAFMSYRAKGITRYTYLTLSALSITLSALTESIQGILLFFISLLIFFVIWTYKKSKKFAGALIAIIATSGPVLFFGLLGYGPLSMLREYTFALRFQYWTIGVKSAISSPIFGLGPDSYVEGFRQFRSLDLVNTYSVELLSDSAHSVPLNIAANFGFIVFLFYIALLTIISYLSMRRTLASGAKFDIYSLFTVLWLALLIQSFISIEQIGLSTTQMIIGGFLLNGSWTNTKSNPSLDKAVTKKAGTQNSFTSTKGIREYKGEISFTALALATLLVLPVFREDVALNEIKVASVDSGASDEVVQEQFDRFSFYTKDEWNRGVWLYNFLLNSRRVEASNELLTSMIAKDTSATEALDQLSKVYLAENRPNDARVTYLRILELEPLNAKVKIALAEVEKTLGNVAEQKEILGGILRDYPNTKWAETATLILSQG